jgi:hypothetical protein
MDVKLSIEGVEIDPALFFEPLGERLDREMAHNCAIARKNTVKNANYLADSLEDTARDIRAGVY